MSDYESRNKRGRAILEIFEERQDAARADVAVDLEEQYSSRSKPGGRGVPRNFDLGNFGHTYAERLIPSLPKGLLKEEKIELADGSSLRMDRVDRDRAIIYEIKPDTPASIAAGEARLKVYVGYMQKMYPKKKWVGVVITYDRAAVLRVAEDIGWIEKKVVKKKRAAKKPTATKPPKSPAKTPKKKAGAAPAGTAPAQPRSARVGNNGVTDRGADASNRLAGGSNRGVAAPALQPSPAPPARATAGTGVPARQRAAPSKAAATPQLARPKKGTHRARLVAVDYNFSNGLERDSLKLKEVDLGAFFRRDSKITHVAKNPALRKLAAATAPTAASLLTSWGLDKIKAHFLAVVADAERNFDLQYPPVDELLADAEINDHRATYDAIVGEEPLWWKNKPNTEVVMQIHGMFDYEAAVIDLIERLTKLAAEIPAIHADVEWRQRALRAVAESLRDVVAQLATIHFGGMLPVYYAALDIWLLGDLFLELAGAVGGLADTIAARLARYERTIDALGEELHRADQPLDAWRSFHDTFEHLIPTD